MKAITVKLDDETAKDLEALVRERGAESQSDLVRLALRRFIAQERLSRRRLALEQYLRDAEAQKEMADLAETGMDEAAHLLRRVED